MARQLGIDQSRVSRLVNGSEWPFARSGWSDAEVKRIKAHLAERREQNNATAGDEDDAGGSAGNEATLRSLSRNPEKLAKLRLIIERTAKIKLERELLAGGYLKKEDVERQRVARIFSVRAKLQEIPLRASLIANKGETECERILSDWMREACDSYANGAN